MKNRAQPVSHHILFRPSGQVGDAAGMPTVLEAASQYGVGLQSECGGQGTCGKCLITAHPRNCLSPISEVERTLLSPEQLARGERLACQARIKGSGVIYSLTSDQVDVSAKTGISGTFPADPAVQRISIARLELPATCGDLVAAASSAALAVSGKEARFTEMSAIGELSRAIRKDGSLTLVCHRERGVTAVLPGKRSRSLGLAVDLGTTTLALYLCDLKKGLVRSAIGAGNPQHFAGADVISRIAYADHHQAGAAILQKSVVDKINELTGLLLSDAGGRREDIDEMVVVGNTTMETLFASFHPHSLGRWPYLPPRLHPGDFRARDLGIALNPGTNVHVFPVISGFLGGDTVAAILSEQPHRQDEVVLLVDIGTNGEVVLGNHKGLWATSCATGPAFEGAHILSGMRAGAGAIYKVEIDAATLQPVYEVLGGNGQPPPPRGICGSGIIDALAAMRRVGLLRPNGRLNEELPGVRVDDRGIGQRFVLVPAADQGREIAITIQDIRQIQVAKAALYTGIKILLRAAGLSHVDRVVLTGAFGARFDWRNAVLIGMLPPLGAEIKVAENAAGSGAILALLDRKRRLEALELAKTVRSVELAAEPDFQTEYISAMNFPDLRGPQDRVALIRSSHIIKNSRRVK